MITCAAQRSGGHPLEVNGNWGQTMRRCVENVKDDMGRQDLGEEMVNLVNNDDGQSALST